MEAWGEVNKHTGDAGVDPGAGKITQGIGLTGSWPLATIPSRATGPRTKAGRPFARRMPGIRPRERLIKVDFADCCECSALPRHASRNAQVWNELGHYARAICADCAALSRRT